MLRISVVLAVAVSALAASPAQAAVADRFLPVLDAADGVTVTLSARNVPTVHFGPKAAKLYRRIGGQKARVGCGSVIARNDGRPPVSGGYGSTVLALPRKRGRVELIDERPQADVCSIATARKPGEYPCLPNSVGDRRCVRVVVALTDLGRAYLDARARAIELDLVRKVIEIAATEDDPVGWLRGFIGRDIDPLPGPDTSPAPGKVGVWLSGENFWIAALLGDGRRLFVRYENGVYSTNVWEFIRVSDGEHVVFQLFI